MSNNKKIFLVLSLFFFTSIHPVFALNLDIQTTCKPVSPNLFGLNTNGYSLLTSSSEFVSTYNPNNLLSSLKPQILRFPGGCPGDSYNYHTSQFQYQTKWGGSGSNEQFMSISQMLEASKQLNTKMLYQINIDATRTANPCGDISAYPNLGSYENNLNKLIDDARDIVSTYGTQIYLYQLGNEQWGNMQGPQYAQIALSFARAMKTVNPDIQIALVSYPTWGIGQPAEANWSSAIMQIKNEQCNGTACFSYLTDHPYADKPPSSNGALLGNTISQYKSSFEKRIGDFSPLKLAVTEWNIGGCWNTFTPPFQSQEQAMYVLKTLGVMAQTGVDISTYHDLTADNSCSIFKSAGQLSLASQSMRLFSEIQPQFFLAINTDNPQISSFGLQGRDGHTYLYFLNQSNTSQTISNINYQSGVQISATSFADQNPTFTNLSGSNKLNLPAFSITRITLYNDSYSCTNSPLPTDIPIKDFQTGDINQDHLVNLNDFLTWKNQYGESNTTLTEFLIWKAAYTSL